ncbi:transposase IS166 family protein [Ruegeria sp. P4]|nr:transposase IS166 family protein [Ruegeria sp. P4]
MRERDALKEANTRLEHLLAELNHAVHGERSEKLAEDDRQLAFEDLEVAIAEVEEKQATQVPSERRPRRAARRNRGNLPETLLRVERVIESASLLCPCGCSEMHKIGEDGPSDWTSCPHSCA